jgi:hypothetical protein
MMGLMNGGLEESNHDLIEVVSQHVPRGNEENHGKSQSG